MSRLGHIVKLEYGLIALCLVLAAAIVIELQGGSSASTAQATVPALATPAVPPQAVVAVPPLASFAAVVERPLFSEVRRPAPVELSITRADAALELRHLVLTGVLIVGPDNQLAILLDRSRGEQVRVRKGQEITGWSLAEVRSNGVTLRKGVTTHDMPLHEEKTLAGTGPASAGDTLPQRAKPQ